MLPDLTSLLHHFSVALALGLLIGLEREHAPAARAGLRTFALVAMFGTLSAMIAQLAAAPLLLPAGLLAVAAFIVVAHVSQPRADDPGTTTVVALLITYGLGILVWHEQITLAIMLTILVTLLLYFKPELRGLTERISRRDLLSILQFGVLSFVILPVLPDQGFGPFAALNPHQIWVMVVLISGLSLSGYIAVKIVGERYGAPLLGILGGLASSTATTLIYAKEARGAPELTPVSVVVILLANLVVTVRLAIVVATVSPTVFPLLAPVLGATFLGGLVVVALSWKLLIPSGASAPLPEVRNPAELRVSLTFGALYATVLILAAWLNNLVGHAGLYGIAAATGLTDVDAITLTSLRLVDLNQIDPQRAVIAIAIGFFANLVFKFGMAAAIGGRRLALGCAAGMGMMALCGALAVAFL